MKRKIALAVIASDEAIDEGFVAMVESVKGKVDGIFVAYTGDPALDEYDQIIEAINGDDFSEGSVVPVGWEDDFSVARNLSFALVHEHEDRHPGTTFDYIFWLDCDDVLPAEFDLQAAIRAMEKKHAHSAFIKYNYATDETGAVTGSHLKERLFRADVDWEWIFPIHENCHGPIASRGIKLKPELFWVDHHRFMRGADKRQRNRRVIAHWYNQDKTNPRAIMYMAHEVFAQAEDESDHQKKYDTYLAALKLYKEFVRVSPINDEVYDCNLQVGRALTQIARFNDAINVYLQCVKQNASNPSAYCGIAETYFAMGEYEQVIAWCQNARAVGKNPNTFGVFEPLDMSYRPFMMEAGALRKLGRYDEALFIYLSEIEPPHAGSEFVQKQAVATQEEWDAELSRPKADPTVQHEMNWGRDADRSVAFFLPPHYEAWNPDTFRAGGLGGTETCVMELAKAFVADGRRVVIYGEPGEDWNGHLVDGIEWYHSSAFHPDQPFDTVISVRIPAIFDANVNARQKIVWLHDVNVGPVRFEDGYDRFSQIDAIVTPSKFAAEHTKLVYGDKKQPFRAPVVPISNGLHVADFIGDRLVTLPPNHEPILDSESVAVHTHATERDPNRFIYASSPDRGLDRLLDLWPEIRAKYPKAWLEIYYGWDAIDRIIDEGLPQAGQLAYFKERIVAKMAALGDKEGGIFWRGRVNHVTLSAAMRKSNLLLYPSDFMETFGIVFAQAALAGCIPIVSNLGALSGQDHVVTVDGPPNSDSFGESFLAAVDEMYDAPHEYRCHISDHAKEFDWPEISREWIDLVNTPTGVTVR